MEIKIMKRLNCQGISMSGNCDVLEDIDLLEEILVRVPHESIFNCALVSKRWFGLICGPHFRGHFVRRWSDEVKSMQRRLLPEPSADLVSEVQHRLQSQQFAALSQLQRRLGEDVPHRISREVAVDYMHSIGSLEEVLHRLHHFRVDGVNELHHKLRLAAGSDDKPRDTVDEYVQFEWVNEMQQGNQPEVLALVKKLMQEFVSPQRWAIVNEVQHQIVCELLVAVNEAQRQQYRDMIFGPDITKN